MTIIPDDFQKFKSEMEDKLFNQKLEAEFEKENQFK